MALLDRFERILEQIIPAPEEAVALVRRGEALLRADDGDGALRLAERARVIAPGYLRALALQCDALVLLARPFDALALLDAAMAERALPVEFVARVAELAAAQGPPSRVAELDAHVRARLRAPQREIASRMLRGARALARWDPSLGLRYARTATLADPALAEAWCTLGEDALARGDLQRAGAMLARASEVLSATDARANARVGALAESLGDSALAARSLRRAWIAGDDADAFARLVGLHARMGDASSLSRLLSGADAPTTSVARALLAVDRPAELAEHLAALPAGEVPEALWALALGAAVRGAPEIAARWVSARPDAPHAPAVSALAALRADGEASIEGLCAHAERALADELTRALAEDALRELLRSRWAEALPRCLDELPRLLRGGTLDAAFMESISLRHSEIDSVLRVAVLGEFSAGKSTFVNALVGREVSPMGVLPTTASVHWLRFGDELARVVDTRGAVTECAVPDASAVIRRLHREGVATSRVEVRLPLTRLASMELIDTPGFNAGDATHERAGRDAMELADLALWLFDARQAGKDSERAPLLMARAAGLPVLGVLNKAEGLSAAELESVRSLLARELGELAPCVAAVSAREALRALAGGSEDRSWADLERGIEAGVIEQRDRWKRARVARRFERDLDAARARLDAMGRSREAASAASAALELELDALRDELREEAVRVRRELSLSLRDQTRAPRSATPEDAVALREDAAAEATWRATRAAMASLRARLDHVESLAMRAGIVDERAAPLVTAPCALWIEQAVREAVRDIEDSGEVTRDAGRWLARALPAIDPLATLRALLDRSSEAPTRDESIARVALDVAVEVCAEHRPPEGEKLDAMTAPSG